MRTTYRRVCGQADGGANASARSHPDVAVTTATTVAPLFGRWSVVTVSAFCVDGSAAVSLGFRAAERGECGDDPFAGAGDGKLRITDGADSTYRVIEQEIVVGAAHSIGVELSELRDGGVEAGRTFAAALLRACDSLFETVRQTVRRNIARRMLPVVTARIEERYGASTRQTVQGLLGTLNWPMMLTASQCGDEWLRTVEYALAHNPLRFHDIGFEGETGIAPLLRVTGGSELSGLADRKAKVLLRRICGEERADEFAAYGRITVESCGYRFVVRPRNLVECFDPQERRANLCIHTISFSCNPIDELVIAYLNIKHRLREYLQTANVHNADPGFDVLCAT